MRGKSMLCLLAFGVMIMASMPVTNAQGTGGEGLQNPTKPTTTSLYFHIFDTFNAFPINTQLPQPEGFFKVGGTNFPSAVVPESNGQVNYDFNTIYGFATSGPVEYNFIENGQPRFHPERGIARDVLIDSTVQPYAYIYVQVRDVIGTPSHTMVLPKFTFRVHMGTGNVIGPDANLDANPAIMDGQLTAYLWDLPMAPPASEIQDPGCNNPGMPSGVCPILVPDADGIIEYKIPMELKDTKIPKVDAYHMRIDWFQDPSHDGSQGDRFAEGYMRLVSDNDHHPRLVMAVKNPVYFEFIHPQVASGILLIHTCENSPWGTYDIDVANMTVAVEGPSVPQDLPVVVSQNMHVHNLHDKCAEVTYLWRFREEQAAEGDYKITVTVQNLNHTAMAIGTASFHVDAKSAYGVSDEGEVVKPAVEDGASNSSPGASFLVVAVLLVGAVMLRRRQA